MKAKLTARIWRVIDAGRILRVLMLAMVTGATAYGFGATPRKIVLVTLCAAFICWGGFFLDFLMDWRKDRLSGKLFNPIASGGVSPRLALTFVIGATGLGAVLAILTRPIILLPAAAVIGIVAGLGAGVLDTPILRAMSLGALQGLYALMGGLAAFASGWGLWLAAVFLFFAMTGGRVLGDVRDLPYDERVGTLTIPRRYGMRRAVLFLLVNEGIAYAVGVAGYFAGGLGAGYLYCMLAIVGGGIIINSVFALEPTPKTADIANRLSLGLLGMLYVLGMVLGRLVR